MPLKLKFKKQKFYVEILKDIPQTYFFLLLFFFLSFIFISWRLITLQYCSGFWHTLTWISHGFTCVLHPASLSIPSLWVFPVHQPRALVSCIQPGLVICFTIDNIHVSMLFSQIIPPLPSPTVQKSVLYICVSFSVLHITISRWLGELTVKFKV